MSVPILLGAQMPEKLRLANNLQVCHPAGSIIYGRLSTCALWCYLFVFDHEKMEIKG